MKASTKLMRRSIIIQGCKTPVNIAAEIVWEVPTRVQASNPRRGEGGIISFTNTVV